MTEHTLLAAWRQTMKRESKHAVVLKHADAFTSGIPDVTITLAGKTSWWEFKHATPKIKWESELQRLTCMRLEAAGDCWLVVYEAKGPCLRTRIVKPSAVAPDGTFESELSCVGFDHKFVCACMLRVHSMRAF